MLLLAGTAERLQDWHGLWRCLRLQVEVVGLGDGCRVVVMQFLVVVVDFMPLQSEGRNSAAAGRQPIIGRWGRHGAGGEGIGRY